MTTDKDLYDRVAQDLCGFDTMSDDAKAKALVTFFIHLTPVKGDVLLASLCTLLTALLPIASAQAHHKDVPHGLSFSEAILSNGHSMLKDALKYSQTDPNYLRCDAVYQTMSFSGDIPQKPQKPH